MAEPALQGMTVEEFLGWEDGTDRRHQLVRGVVTMTAPPQHVHGRLVGRLARRLGAQLEPPCEPVVEAGIKPPHRDDTCYQADLAVSCRPPRRGEVYLAEPIVVVEVLSPSTAALDRLAKLDDYRLIPSVTDIVLVAGTAIRVEHWHRSGRVWTVAVLGLGERLELPELDVSIALDELYADLPLGEDKPSRIPETGEH